MSDEKDITDKDIYDACELLRKVYLRLDESVMPFNSRLTHAKYYGRLRLQLAILKGRSDMKTGNAQDIGDLPTIEEIANMEI